MPPALPTTWIEVSALITSVSLLLATVGRGIVWTVQRQSRRTIQKWREYATWLEHENQCLRCTLGLSPDAELPSCTTCSFRSSTSGNSCGSGNRNDD